MPRIISKTSQTCKRPTTPTSQSKKMPTGSQKRTSSRTKLTELSMNMNGNQDAFNGTDKPNRYMYGSIDGETTLRFTHEKLRELNKGDINAKDYINNNLGAVNGYLELVGWSRGKHLPNSFYDTLFNADLQIRRLALRGRGVWTTCHCPKVQSRCGEQIDNISKENITHLEYLYIFRPFTISSCALLDLISRSPNLKVVRFYAYLEKSDGDHHSAFESVRFLSSLEGIYWPWCNKKNHLPTLKTLLSRHDQLETFHCPAETTCDLISAERLLNLKHLSLNLNESWGYAVTSETLEIIDQDTSMNEDEKEALKNKKRERNRRRLMKSLPNRIEKLAHLTQLDKVEALEIRSYHFEFEEEESNEETNATITERYETYQLKFWECVAKMRSLKYLAIYGGWDLDKVARELAKHGMQIEYFKTNLMPTSLVISIKESTDEEQPLDSDGEKKVVKLNLIDSTRHLVKLAKLKSLYISYVELLADLHNDTKVALKEVSDLIWRIDLRVPLTPLVDDVLNQILKRGNQSGRTYRIMLVIEPDDPLKAKFYIETVLKFSTTSTVREKLIALSQSECKQRFGRTTYKEVSIWGIEQACGRDRGSYEQLKSSWDTYNEVFRPIDRFV